MGLKEVKMPNLSAQRRDVTHLVVADPPVCYNPNPLLLLVGLFLPPLPSRAPSPLLGLESLTCFTGLARGAPFRSSNDAHRTQPFARGGAARALSRT